MQDSGEKLKTPITAQKIEGILMQEAQEKDIVETTKENFEKFNVMWKGVQ